jgi:pyruvate dehydrogenase E2 component (dihydrolipoamide acetyltransferase)
MSEFKMPSLGADMDAGTLVEWKKKSGDPVKRGDIIAAVETAKGVIEVECFEDGILDEVFFQAGQEVPVGQVLATIVSKEEYGKPKSVPVTQKPAEPVKIEKIPEMVMTEAAKAPAVNVVEQIKTEVAQPPASGARVRISPLASRMAIELGVDLRQVKGTGPGGAIQRVDIERAAQAQKAAPAPVPAPVELPKPEVKAPPVAEKPAPAPVEAKAEPVPEVKKPTDFQTAMRQAIAAAMSKSNRDIPHYYMETSIDMTNALNWLEQENLKRTIRDRLLPVVVLLKAVAKSLTEVPELNGFWIDGAHQVSESIHIGFAINLRQGGLITPAIHDADMKSFDELREAMNDLIIRTRGNRLRSSELTDSTITVTSLGDRGVEKVFGVIYPPQVALVGLGKITQQPWAVNGALCVRPVLVATLAGDHRATDGHKGGLFLEALNRNLQEVEKL